MDIIQNSDDYRWEKCLVAFESGNESETKSKEENENFQYYKQAEINLIILCRNENG